MIILLSLLFFITVIYDGYVAWTNNDTHTMIGMCIGVPAILSLPIALIATRAANLAKIYILTHDYIKVYIPFRKAKKLSITIFAMYQFLMLDMECLAFYHPTCV